MDYVRVGTKNFTKSQKARKAERLFNKMDGNPNFPNPVPSLADMKIAYISRDKAIVDAGNGGKIELSALRARARELDDLIPL